MRKEPINPDTLPEPHGWSHGVKVGDTVWLGGQTALDADMQIVPGGIVEQFRQALSNVLATLEAAGGAPADIVDMTIYLTDVPDYLAHGKQIGAVWKELMGTDYPAMAGIGITRLWQEEALVEVKGVAVIGCGSA